MEGCGMKCLKYLMVFFNLLFFLCGGVLLGMGIWVVVDGANFASVVGGNPIIFTAVYIIIAVGVALLLIAFLGCCGAMKENKCMLGTFFAIVLIIFIIEIVGAILAFVYYPNLESLILTSMMNYDNNENTTDPVSQGWNTMQLVFGCCGWTNPSNWRNSSNAFNGTSNPFPESCCSGADTPNDRQMCFAETPGHFYSVGCETQIRTYFWALGGAGIGILVVELMAMIFACCLYRSVDKGDYA